MRRGLGPDPSGSKSSRQDSGLQGRNSDTHGVVAAAHAASRSQQSHDDSRIHADDEAWGLATSKDERDIIEAEYAAYYQRRESRRREQSEKNRQQFERVAAHASRRQEENTPFVSAANSDTRKFDNDDADEDGVGAAALAARRAVLAMSDEEKEAAFARHEERQALSKYAVDLKPEGLHLNPIIRKELEKAVNLIQTVRDSAKQSSNCERTTKKIRSSSFGMNTSYFKGKRSSNHDSNEAYKDAVSRRMETREYQSMLKQRRKLPAYQMSGSIADTILDPKVSTAVISGETGSGKTTQVPRVLVETAAQRGMGRINILVAQPRRIAAVGVAERVADEGGTGCSPGDADCDVGYHIRHERRVGQNANIVFATTGVVLRILAGDPMLQGVDVVIIDEVHERSSDGDFLITVLRDLSTGIERGPGTERPLKLLLMSATVDSDFFVNYLDEAKSSKSGDKSNRVPLVHVEGVAHPVQDLYLEDAVHAINSSGDFVQNSEDMFDLDFGRGGGGRRKKRGWKKGVSSRQKGGGDGKRGEREEELVRSRRKGYIEEKFSETTANLVEDFDIRAKISEKDLHLKSMSSGDLPLGLALHLVFYLDRRHRPKDNGDGAILVFLPGVDDIYKLDDAFRAASGSNNALYAREMRNLHVLCLHGSMPTSEQREIFRRPPDGKRKVVLSTNVAESSITIDDVVYCLDLGKHKEKTYDPTSHIECLLPTWISKASARQRRGRAGRVRAGECWHLYPSWYINSGVGIDDKSKDQNTPGGDNDPEPGFVGDVKLRAFALPEMLRTPLEEVCLRARFLGLAQRGAGGVEFFLSRCPSPPGPLSLHNAIEALGPADMMLLRSDTEELTPMGLAVSKIPLPPRFGLALMLSDYLGCEEEVLTISALLSGKSVFYAPFERKSEADRAKRKFAEDTPSDLYGAVQAYHAWEKAEASGDAWSFCRQHYISRQAMITARANRRQLSRDLESSKLEIFGETRLRPPGGSATQSHSQRDDSDHLWQQWGRVMGVLSASFGGSNLARLDHNGSGKCRCPIYTKSHGRVKLFPSSVSSPDGAAKDVASRGTTYYIHRWGIYMEKVRNSGGICLYDINEVSPLVLSVCASGERVYSDEETGSDSLLPISPSNGKVVWTDREVEAMTSRLNLLRRLSDGGDVSDVERVGARIEIEDIEARLGIVDIIGEDQGSPGHQSADIDTRVLNFVVSAIETNGGMYGMAALRRMMKEDMDLYNAMGPVRNFAAQHSSILSLEKVGGKWMFVLKPGAKDVLAGRSIGSSPADTDRTSFFGPKQWVYFDMNEEERECIGKVRAAFRDIVNAGVSGRLLLPEEENFLAAVGWAFQEEFMKSN